MSEGGNPTVMGTLVTGVDLKVKRLEKVKINT